MRTAAKTHSAPDGSVDVTGHALGVAHDLRNLLFVMSAQLQRATRQLPADDPLRHELDVIRDTSDRASALTRYFLSSGRGVPMPQPAADINAVVRGMKHVLAQVVGTRICLRIKLARRLWPVAVHSTQIERVLLNLVINARDAMPEGGTVCITTENQRAEGEAGEGSVVVTVRDTGVGMPPRVRAQVFEPFYTTKPGGTGIGLTTVRAIASIAGGGVDIDTVAGKGTAVSVSLPRTRRTPGARRNNRVHAHQFTRVQDRAGRATRILLVDDEPSVRDLLRDYLESRGFELTVAATGAEALESVQGGACPDLLVTDVHLPDTLGPEVARRLREHVPSMPVVFMSGAPEAATAVAGASDVPMLTKPFSMTELDRAVRAALGTAANRE